MLNEREFDELFRDKEYIMLPPFEEVSQDKNRYFDFHDVTIGWYEKKKDFGAKR